MRGELHQHRGIGMEVLGGANWSEAFGRCLLSVRYSAVDRQLFGDERVGQETAHSAETVQASDGLYFIALECCETGRKGKEEACAVNPLPPPRRIEGTDGSGTTSSGTGGRPSVCQ